ncbi:SDR family NAD(P)-dependent oxidoreductase [Erythrobacter arachoides]|uniref:SDR family NAD(P)-dependent oxidoreductase n=1 Tax=Aurantiacibacter arachoides TaxID=1850444 RepID=A0A844ZXF7_9SPHN|nr:complex I NDUFA9 subunit family protein [Aurantiacibacter arachoides]MXO92144.1 SDR family NAD(P)-dependent oxidoreductase [Aurantiacibacter arachoides]GGD59351.1 3-beta-hydroxy-Delta(5)-steroid dehydrogenase [Aurantiacibacter arachoides]
MTKPSPLADKLVVLIGGSGFIGSHVAQELLERGARVRIAAREPEKAFRLKPLANLGQLQFARCNVRDRHSLAACVTGADAVIYLVGTFGADQRALQATGAGAAAQAAYDTGAQGFVYLSAIGADAAKETGYYRTKGEGEALVRQAFPRATILRPSAVFGEEDGFVPMFADLVSKLPVLPVFGAQSQLQPVWVDDLATGIVNALEDPGAHGGKTYEAAGPEALSMMQINTMIGEAQGRKRSFFAMPDALAKLVAAMPMTPINGDQYAMLEEGSTATPGMPQIDALGVTPRPLSLFLDKWMVRYRKHGRFSDKRTA